MSKEEFEANLEASGWTKTTITSEDGKPVDRFTKGDASYDVYQATSTKGPSAQFKPSQHGQVTLKIRLKGGGE